MEFKELFALKAAEPIISLGVHTVYEEYELPEDEPMNEVQMGYDIYKPKVEKVEEAPKPELTRAEKKRAKQAERVRERQERRERWMREQEEVAVVRMEEVRARDAQRIVHPQVRILAPQVPAPQVPAPAPQVPVPARAPARAPAPAPQVPVQNLNDPVVKAQVDAIDPGTRRLKFWAIITQLNWHNASDGAMPAGPITALFNGLSALDALVFKLEYENTFTGTMEFLRDDGMFDRNGAHDHRSRARIVSHIIALGEDQHVTLIGDPAILQFLVESGECQSLNDLLPENIKI